MRIENGVLKKVFKKDVVKWVCVIPDGVTSIGDWAFPSWVKVVRG